MPYTDKEKKREWREKNKDRDAARQREWREKNGTLEPKQATEMNNAAGKIINTVKVQLEYADMRNETPNIPFMNTGDDNG